MIKISSKNIYRKIWLILTAKQKKSLIALFAFVLIGTLLETISIGVIIPILNIFASKQEGFYESYRNWWPYLDSKEKVQIMLLSLLIVIYIVKGLFLSFLTWYQNRFSFGLTADISNRLFQGYIYREYDFHLKRNSAELIRNITTEVGSFSSVLLAGIVVLSEISIVCSIIVLLFVINPFGAIISFVVLSILGSVFSMTAKKYNILGVRSGVIMTR
jgi:ABC-type multidrug transport system fused ATPase/permease subunit